MGRAQQRCPAIVGPTAVGKTGLITRLADSYPIEVISLDSRQIYRGLRIGTAQPTASDLAVCPHHLIDFVSPLAKYDAVRFRADFERVHQQIVERGARPVLVGGAGMYLSALREGFMTIPGHSPARLAEVRTELELLSDDEIRRELSGVDRESFRRIHTNDRYRSQRALEIYRISGEPMTALMARQQADPSLDLEFPTFVLERAVPDLDTRIAERTAAMLSGGWLEETQTALTSYPADCPGLRSIGYREIVRHLQGDLAGPDLAAAIVLVTRQYAKRQRTLFRHLPRQGSWRPDDPALVIALGETLASL